MWLYLIKKRKGLLVNSGQGPVSLPTYFHDLRWSISKTRLLSLETLSQCPHQNNHYSTDSVRILIVTYKPQI